MQKQYESFKVNARTFIGNLYASNVLSPVKASPVEFNNNYHSLFVFEQKACRYELEILSFLITYLYTPHRYAKTLKT